MEIPFRPRAQPNMYIPLQYAMLQEHHIIESDPLQKHHQKFYAVRYSYN